MTLPAWNPDGAVVARMDDTDDMLASVWRYGVTDWEAGHGEPFDVALAQEAPEDPVDRETDEQWVHVDDADPFPGRLIADDRLRDDDYALAIDDSDEYAPEELAMHLVAP